MAKTKVKEYNIDEAKALLGHIENNIKRLWAYIRSHGDKPPTFHDACNIRNAAQHLTESLLAADDMKDTTLKLIELDGPRPIFTDNCGLDWVPE